MTIRGERFGARFSGETIIVDSDGATWVIEDPEAVERIRESVESQVESARAMAARVHELRPAIELAESIAASIDHEAIAEAVAAAHEAADLAMEGIHEARLEALSAEIEKSVERAMRESERSIRQSERQIRVHELEMRRFEREMKVFEREMEKLGERIGADVDAAIRTEIERGNARRVD